MKAWLIIGLLTVGLNQSVPKQADKSQTNQDGGKDLSSQPPKPDIGGTENVPPSGPSSTKKEDSTDSKTEQPSWCEKLLAPLVANWPLVAVAAWGIIVAIRTLNTIREQTEATRKAAEASERSITLQEVALRQWVSLEKWRALPYIREDGEITLHIEFDVVNPTNLPFTLNSVSTVIDGQQGNVSHKNLIPPKNRHAIKMPIKITEEQVVKWNKDKLVFPVNGLVSYTNALEQVREQPFSGVIMCSKSGAKFVRRDQILGSGLHLIEEDNN